MDWNINMEQDPTSEKSSLLTTEKNFDQNEQVSNVNKDQAGLNNWIVTRERSVDSGDIS